MILRLQTTKIGKIRFASHRDIAKVWERSLRRAEIPLVYSEGFSPRPRIAFGLALPTGAESECEYLDFHLDDQKYETSNISSIPKFLLVKCCLHSRYSMTFSTHRYISKKPISLLM